MLIRLLCLLSVKIMREMYGQVVMESDYIVFKKTHEKKLTRKNLMTISERIKLRRTNTRRTNVGKTNIRRTNIGRKDIWIYRT